MNHCQYKGCKKEAKKGQQLCREHVPTSISASNTVEEQLLEPQLHTMLTVTSTLQPISIGPSGNRLAVTQEQSQSVGPLAHQLQLLQAENIRLLDENKRIYQVEADRLRFEKESRDAWNEVKRLTEINEELRAENKRLQGRVADLEGEMKELKAQVVELTDEVKELKCNPLHIEVAQLFQILETIVVNTISDDDGCASYLSDVDIKPNNDAVKKWEEHFHLKAKDLFALRTIITTIRAPRNKVAHPEVNPAHAEQWKETLREYCPIRVTDESIQHLIDIAVHEYYNHGSGK